LLAASRPTEVLTEAPKYRYAPALSWAPAASTPNSTVQHTGSAIVGGSPISRRLDTEFESLARAAAAALPAGFYTFSFREEEFWISIREFPEATFARSSSRLPGNSFREFPGFFLKKSARTVRSCL